MSGKVFVTRVVMAMAAMVPGAAFAALPAASELCASGSADPVAFRARTDFEDAVGSMAAVCPEIVLMLLQKPTQTVPELGGDASDDEVAVDDGAGDSGETVSALGAALAALTQATADVTTAQAVLEQATVRVRMTRNLRESLLQDIDLDIEIEQRILADFTEMLRSALVEYQAARDDLDSKSEALDTARGMAIEALDIHSLEVAKIAADESLSSQLGDTDYEDLRDEFDEVYTEASGVWRRTLDELKGLRNELFALQNELEGSASREELVAAHSAANDDVTQKRLEFMAAEGAYLPTTVIYDRKEAAYNACKCEDALAALLDYDRERKPLVNAYNDAVSASLLAEGVFERANDAISRYDDLPSLISGAEQSVAIAQTAFVKAGNAMVAANEDLDNLTDLNDAVVAAGLALETANEQVEEDPGVVAAQGAVMSAEARLDNAIEQAVDVLEGSEEEAAAKAAIVTAQAALDAALAAQAEAVAAADAAMDAAEGVDAPEVAAAVAELDAALGAADAADETALDAGDVAVEVLQDHADAKEALRTELVEDEVIKPEPKDWDHIGDDQPAEEVSAASVSDEEGAASVAASGDSDSDSDGVSAGAEGGETAAASEGGADETSSGGGSAEGGAAEGGAAEGDTGGDASDAAGDAAGGGASESAGSESAGSESAGSESAGGAGDGTDAEPAADAPAT